MDVLISPRWREIADGVQTKGEEVRFAVKCSCGGREFYVWKNTPTQKSEEQKAFEAFAGRCKWRSYYVRREEDGLVAYRKNLFGKVVDRAKVPEDADGATVVRIRCAACQREFVLYDSRVQGYDSVMDEGDHADLPAPDAWTAVPRSGEALELSVRVWNDLPFEEFAEDYGEGATPEVYAEAFSWIEISGRREGQKRKIVIADEERA